MIRPGILTSDYASVLRLAIAGAGIGPVPDLVAAAHVASGALLPVLANWSLSEGQLYAISLSGQHAPARVRVFREFVRTELNSEFLDFLRGVEDLEWTFLSPSAKFVPGERTGKFRLGLDHLLTHDGGSSISFEDYAVALVDELETPRHVRQRFTVGY